MVKRLALWEECRLKNQLRRVEEHLLINRKRKLVARPHRKATTRLVSSMLSFEERGDLSWEELLQTCFLGAQAYIDPLLESPPAPP